MYPLALGEAQYTKWRKIEIGAQSLLFMCNEVQLIQFKKESPCHNLRDFVFEMVESPGISIRSHVRFMKPGFPLIFTYFTLNMKRWNEKKRDCKFLDGISYSHHQHGKRCMQSVWRIDVWTCSARFMFSYSRKHENLIDSFRLSAKLFWTVTMQFK